MNGVMLYILNVTRTDVYEGHQCCQEQTRQEKTMFNVLIAKHETMA